MSPVFELLPAQRALFETPHDEPTDLALYQGGVGSGKTTAGVLLGCLLSVLYPGSRGLVGALHSTLLADTTRRRWEEILPAGLIRSWKRDPDNLVLRNGSQVWFRHLSDPSRLSGMEFNWIHADEGGLLPEATFHALLARLRYGGFRTRTPEMKRRFRLFITSNPQEEEGWLHRVFIEPRSPAPNRRFIRAPTSENRHLLALKPDYEALIRSLVDETYARIYLEGETGRVEAGRVYRNFDEGRHVSARAVYDPSRTLHLSFDFNVDFMISLVIQESEEATLVVDEVVLRGGHDTPSLCEAILKRYGGHAGGLVVHGDQSGFSRHHRGLHSDYALIRGALGRLPGFRLKSPTPGANPPIRDRTNWVNFRLLNDRGEARLLVAPGCRSLIRSLKQTRFIPGSFEKEKQRDPRHDRFEVDHPGDALDYYIADEHPFDRRRLGLWSYL